MDHLGNCKPINPWVVESSLMYVSMCKSGVYALAQFNQVLPSDNLFGYVSNISVYHNIIFPGQMWED